MADCDTKVDDNTAPAAVTPQSLVTESNVRAALTADKGIKARLIAWKVVDFIKPGINYMSVVSSVEVKYELDGQNSEVTYVVKLNSCKTGFVAEGLSDVAFPKEAKFYLTLVPELNRSLNEVGQRNLNFPACYGANLEKGKDVLFLEDLRKRGYKMLDSRRGLDEAHATLVMRELAKLHAASLLLQNKYPGEDLSEKYPFLKKDFYDYIKTKGFRVMVKSSLTLAQGILRKVGGYERAIAWIDTLIPKLVDIFYEQLKCGEPKVVCHGDCWINNFLFKYDAAGHPEGVMLFDLQLLNYGPLTPDINYLMYSSMAGDVRKANLQTLLNCYHDCLTEIMEAAGQGAPFTKEQLLKDFKDKNLFGVIIGMMTVPMLVLQSGGAVDSSKDYVEYIEEKITNSPNAMARAMDTLDTNPLLKPRLLSIFDDMMEDGLRKGLFAAL